MKNTFLIGILNASWWCESSRSFKSLSRFECVSHNFCVAPSGAVWNLVNCLKWCRPSRLRLLMRSASLNIKWFVLRLAALGYIFLYQHNASLWPSFQRWGGFCNTGSHISEEIYECASKTETSRGLLLSLWIKLKWERSCTIGNEVRRFPQFLLWETRKNSTSCCACK